MVMGSTLEQEFRNSLQYYKNYKENKLLEGLFWIKLYDDSRRFRKRPFDFLVLTGRHSYAFECKMVRLNYFPFSYVPKHQEEGLIEVADLKKSKSYLIINFKIKNRQINRCFAMPIHNFRLLREELKRKSIPFDVFVEGEYCIELKRKKFGNKNYKYGWDLGGVFL